MTAKQRKVGLELTKDGGIVAGALIICEVVRVLLGL